MTFPAAAPDDAPDVTRLLQALDAGEPGATDALARAVYDHLHAIAARQMRREDPAHTLQATVLVHEAFLRLVEQRSTDWRNRAQFYQLAARMMRRVLLDHARRRRARKRDSGPLLALEDATQLAAIQPDERIGALEEALTELGLHEPRAAQVVELRWFGGLGIDEAAEALAVSPSTVKREWRFAQAFLRRALGEPASSAAPTL